MHTTMSDGDEIIQIFTQQNRRDQNRREHANVERV